MADDNNNAAADNAAAMQTAENDADSNAVMPTMEENAPTPMTDNDADDGQQ